jgi:hypothetical protein
MSIKKVLVAASASLAGLMMLVCTWSSALAQTQKVYLCNLYTAVPAKGTTVATCLTDGALLPSFTNDFNVAFVSADASASSASVTINSIEVTLNGRDGAGVVDFMDIAFSPYVDTVGGGGIPNNQTTYGGFNSPNIDLCKTTITTWLTTGQGPFPGTPPFTLQFELQVFVSNSSASPQSVSGTLRVIANTNIGLCP